MPNPSLFNRILPFVSHENESIEDLGDIIKNYPYFSLAYVLLLNKNKTAGGPDDDASGMGALHTISPAVLNLGQLRIQPGREEKPEVQFEKYGKEDAPAPEFDQQTSADDALLETESIHVPAAESNIQSGTEEEKISLPDSTHTESKDELPIFEPLYSTDYFASQGIRLSEEVHPGDKLGNQLKSFTQWLKTMKKVHDSRLPAGNEQLDATINKLADKSNQDAEVLTEAMADAFLVQGKSEKAREVYHKLSLLNPSKNAYFAAKLEQIK